METDEVVPKNNLTVIEALKEGMPKVTLFDVALLIIFSLVLLPWLRADSTPKRDFERPPTKQGIVVEDCRIVPARDKKVGFSQLHLHQAADWSVDCHAKSDYHLSFVNGNTISS